MAHTEYYKTALKKVHFPTRDYRGFANSIASNECRLLRTIDGQVKIAPQDSERVGLSEYVCKVVNNMFPTNFPKRVFRQKNDLFSWIRC